MAFHLGLTGSIGMGKSTTAKLFAEEGCAVWDADAAVHRVYGEGGAAVEPISGVFPAAIVKGVVDRQALKAIIAKDPSALKQIETIVHPLLGADRETFKAEATQEILVFDIPLLFETGADAEMDATACVTTTAETQRARVLARGTMNEAQFEQILSKQMPNAEKRVRSDYVIETDTLDHAREQVAAIVADIKGQMADA